MMDGNGVKVLLIDDESAIRRLCKVALSACGYIVQEAVDAQEGLVALANNCADIVILDLGLPDLDGKQVVTQIREWSTVPVIVLTARDQEQEKIAALDAGADDYMTKPFSVGELMARMRVCLRRVGSEVDKPLISCGKIKIDIAAHLAYLDGEELKLTPLEYELLKLLVKNVGKVLTHKQILKSVWGEGFANDSHYVRIYIKQLRKKIEPDPTQPIYIVTESGVGYRLLEP